MRILAIISFVVFCSLSLSAKVDFIFVKKSESKLYVYQDGLAIHTFNIALGANPEGHKQQEGDEKTPEGLYKINYKKKNSQFYRSLKINYPNKEDRRLAKKAGRNPGGDIFIHGFPNNFRKTFEGWPKGIVDWIMNDGKDLHYLYNWTDGCIAVTNDEMDILWKLIDKGTFIKIEY